MSVFENIKQNLEGPMLNYQCRQATCGWSWDSPMWVAECPKCKSTLIAQVGKTLDAKPSLFQEADKIINGPRREAYGSLEESFDRIALTWSAVLKIKVTAQQVVLCMLGLKLCREANKHGEDNIVDIYGYTLCYEKLVGL